MRPALKALAEQQIVIEAQAKALDAIAAKTGTDITPFKREAVRRVASFRRTADEANPANPIPEPAAQGAEITTQQAATPEATTDVTTPMGQVATEGVTPDATTDVTQPTAGAVLDVPLSLNDVDVTAPVQGTQAVEGDNRVETEIVSDVDNPPVDTPMFPVDNLGPSTGSSRAFAALRLARLRIQAGIAPAQDDLLLGQSIASNAAISDAAILQETATLDQVTKAAGRSLNGQPVSRSLVPRTASGSAQGEPRRGVPSLVTSASVSQVEYPSNAVSPDEVNW